MGFRFENSNHYANYISKILAKQNININNRQKSVFALFFEFCKFHRIQNALQLSYKLNFDNILELEDVILNKASKNQDVFHVCMENGNSGLYFLKNKDFQILYIGKSKNLVNRSLSSAVERDPLNIKYVSFMFMPYCNSHILEPYYILQSKPYYNTEFLNEDINQNDLIEIKHNYKMSNDIDIQQNTAFASFKWGNFYQELFGVENGK